MKTTLTEAEQFRYALEHKLLPDMLYTQKVNMINAILDKGGKFFSDIYLIYSPTADIVYKEEDFSISAKRCKSDNKMLYYVIVTMPEPTAFLLCKRVYFCYEDTTGVVKYYTSEQSADGGLMMCSWDEKKRHSNYGSSPMDEELEFRKIGNLFLKDILGE